MDCCRSAASSCWSLGDADIMRDNGAEGNYALGCNGIEEERDRGGEKGGSALMNNFTAEFGRGMYYSFACICTKPSLFIIIGHIYP